MLTPDGYRLRDLIAEDGYEVTPDELERSLSELEEYFSGGEKESIDGDCEG